MKEKREIKKRNTLRSLGCGAHIVMLSVCSLISECVGDAAVRGLCYAKASMNLPVSAEALAALGVKAAAMA